MASVHLLPSAVVVVTVYDRYINTKILQAAASHPPKLDYVNNSILKIFHLLPFAFGRQYSFDFS